VSRSKDYTSLIANLASPDNRTENTLATMFMDLNCGKFRYVREWDRWLYWDGSRWLHDANENLITREARRFGDILLDQLGDSLRRLPEDELSKIVTFVRFANGSRGIKNFIELSQSDSRVSVGYKELNQGSLLFNAQNGTIDLASGFLREHNPDDLLTQIAAVPYSRFANCPKWCSAVSTIFGADEDLIRYVRQLIGYSISGQCGEHILPICYGSGFNGKSFLWNTVLRVVGDYGFLANDSLLLGEKHSHPTEKAALYQRRFVPISEPDQDSRLRESRVKELTGDSTITARRMHEDFWSFDRSHTFWLSSNHLPKIQGTDEGIWRRIKLIPFVVDLRNKVAPIANYDEVLFIEEGQGILNWIVDGFLDYQEFGLLEPEVVKDATKHYRQDSDEVASFVDEVCLVGPHLMAPANKLFSEFQRWGGKASRTSFGLKLAERFTKDKPNAGEFRKQVLYHGIGLSGDDSH
jgi:putative DNA primase/helicase